MNCADFDTWLRDTVDQRERALPEAVSRHLAGCPYCRATWSSESALDHAFARWKAAPLATLPHNVLAERIVPHALPNQPAQALVRLRRWSLVPVAAALAALIAAGIAINHHSAPPASVGSLQSRTLPRDEPLSESIVAAWDSMRMTPQHVVRETLESIDRLTQLPVTAPTPTPDALEDEQPAQLPLLSPWLPWSEPIGERLNAGFGFLGDVVSLPAAG